MAMIPNPEAKSFSEIRQSLNPCCSYIILEGEAGENAAEEVQKAFDMLPIKAGDVLERRLYREIQTQRLLLVARLARSRGDRLKQRILAWQIGSNLTLHYYGSSPEGQRHKVERR